MFNLELLPNEKVLKIYRQSEMVLFAPVLIVFGAIYFPWYFLLEYDLAGDYIRLLLFWTILVLLYALNKYLLWLLNSYVVTDQRLIFVNYKSLFHKDVKESPLKQIVNVSFSIKGLWQSLFKFGAVEILAAGFNEPMVFKNLRHPDQVKDYLWQIHSGSASNTSVQRPN